MARINWSRFKRSTLARFWVKAFNDWVFEFAGMLAYYLLLAIVPILLLMIGGVGLILQGLNPGTQARLIQALSGAFPKEISGGLIAAVTNDLKASSGALLAVGLVTALLFGSRLLVRLDECITIIYREHPRSWVGQNLVSMGLTLLFVILAPIMFLAAAVPSFLTTKVAQAFQEGNVPTPGVISQPVGFIGAYLAAFVWVLAVYMLVPSRSVGLRHSWPGAALAALLLIVYELIFPLIAGLLLHPGRYGETAGFLILVISFFYYFAFLLLLGAEVNSWLAGHREMREDVPTVLHHAIVHRRLPELPPDTLRSRHAAAHEAAAHQAALLEAPPASQNGSSEPKAEAADGASSGSPTRRPTEPDIRAPAAN